MDEKELIGKTLAIWNCNSLSDREVMPILHGTVQDRDGVLTLDLGREDLPIHIQSGWLEKIEPTPEFLKVVSSNSEYYLPVGPPPLATDENNALGLWVDQKNKAKKAQRIRWMLSGATICGGYALWRVVSGQAYIVSVIVQMLFGAWIGSMLVKNTWRVRIGFLAVGCSAVALNFFYSRLLKHLWPSGSTCCGTTNAKEYNYGFESQMLTLCTMLLFFFIQDRLSKRKK